jgi:hypothetical protein
MSKVITKHIADDSVTKAKINADIAGSGLSQAVGGELDVNVDNTTVEVSADALQVKDLGVGTGKLAATSVTAAKLGSDVAGNGLGGGNGSALVAAADATGGANLATAINVSANGIAVKIDDSTIGENASHQLEIKDDAVDSSKVDLTDDFTWSGTHDFTAGTIHVPAPSSDTHAATKAYVDAKAEGYSPKGTCKALADTNQTLANLPTNIDGITSWSDGDEILLINQTDASENGIWVVKDSAAWIRPDDFPADGSAAGASVWVNQGATYGDQRWVCTNDPGGDVIDTDNLDWQVDGGIANLTAGAGLTKTGNTVNVGDGTIGNVGGIARTADDITVAVDNTTVEISSNVVQVKDLGVGTGKLAATSVTAAKLGSDVAGNGLGGGNGSAITVSADATGGANLAKSINVSANGVAVKIDDSSIYGNGSDQLAIKADGVAKTHLNPDCAGVGIQQLGDGALGLDVHGLTAETTPASDDEVVLYDSSASALRKMTRSNFLAGVGSGETRVQEMHLITSGETTNGYFTLGHSPTSAGNVAVSAVGGIRQVNKQVVGSTGATADFDVLNTNQLHFNNNGAATGLSEELTTGDILIIEYAY